MIRNRASLIVLAAALCVGACGEDETPLISGGADASSDASGGDASGADDTGTTDAGGAGDAGAADAGSADSGSADAGSTDAGSDDAGMDDATMDDGGMDDATMDDGGMVDAGADSGDCVPYEAVAEILVVSCANSYCHGAPSNASGLNLEDGYASLVNVASVGAPGETRVVPGDPDGSYLVHKIEGSATAGNRMPPIGPLDPAEIETIRAWIASGAAETCE